MTVLPKIELVHNEKMVFILEIRCTLIVNFDMVLRYLFYKCSVELFFNNYFT